MDGYVETSLGSIPKGSMQAEPLKCHSLLSKK